MLSCLLATSTSLYARGGNGNGGGNRANQMSFSLYDANKDGKISVDEFNKARTDRAEQRVKEGRMMRNIANAPTFGDIDADKDGFLSKDEILDFQKSRQRR